MASTKHEPPAMISPPGSIEGKLQEQYLETTGPHGGPIKLDSRGLPLVPQPSDDPADPLNWPVWLKHVVLIQVSWLSLLAVGSSAIINPSYVQLGAYFGVSAQVAGYPSQTNIVGAGLAPFLWIPLSNVYGKRLVLLVSSIVGIAAAIGCGAVSSFWQLYITRTIQGVANGATMAIGAGVVSDLFFVHEKGKKMGIYTVFLTNGAHLMVIPGGYLAQYVGWRWAFYFTAILQGAVVISIFFTCPETLYVRTYEKDFERHEHPIRRRLSLFGNRPPGRKLAFGQIWGCLAMIKYPSVLFAAFYHAIAFTFGSVMPSLTSSALFFRFYGFRSARVGLVVGLSTLIGAILGEVISSQTLDRLAARARKRNDGDVKPESRLHGIWVGFVTLPAGMLIFGLCIQHERTYIGPAIGMALASLAVQVISATLYTYVSDCYRPQTGESAQVINIARQLADFHIGFWALPFGNKAGFDASFGTYAAICVAAAFPIFALMRYGERWRARMGQPTINHDL